MSVNTETASRGQTTVLEKGAFTPPCLKNQPDPGLQPGISMRFWMTPRFLTLRRVNA